MSTAEAMRIALTAIVANRLRAALTVLGVVIGVMSVVLLVAIGNGAREEVTAGVEGLGSNLLIVVPGSFEFGSAPSRSRFTLDDAERIERQLGPRAQVSGTLASGELVRSGDSDSFASVLGVSAQYDEVVNRPIARGDFFSESDILVGRRVAVLGSAAGEGLFPGTDPIGESVTVGGLRFRVVGVLEEQGATLGVSRDTEVLMPITAAQRLFGTRRVDTIVVKAPGAEVLDELSAEIDAVLSARFGPGEFTVLTQDQILGVVGDLLGTLTLVLAAIAGISLLVGGVGVSNIMLVSVQERTREIGLRKALGARTRDVTLQFLLEAVVLCGLGGLVGIGLGVGLAMLAERLTPLPATVTGWSVALAFGVSVAIGIAFGVFPARRAGRLDPVVALRYE
ncbi:MAG: FtsX-like permease family protein [Nitriliruptorales bacterium]|nr:FtsX-like permease family protein [Nitriliruptorales bacterium]